MLPKVTIKLVKTQQEKDEVTAFGLTFDHELEEHHWKHPIFAVRNEEGKLIGFQIVQTSPIIYSGWSPEIKPIELWAAHQQIDNWDKLDSELTGRERAYVAVALDHPTFTPKTMAKFGQNRINIELYQGNK